MAFGYRYRLERQDNGWWLVRFPGVPEALTEGETEKEARANTLDCVLAALEGYMKAGRPLPRQGASHSGQDRAILPSLVTAKLAVYETMRSRGWSVRSGVSGRAAEGGSAAEATTVLPVTLVGGAAT
jgi:predicted RNase H-like HicB family nuclease